MKPNFYTESVLYWGARKVSAVAQKLPPEWNVRVGAAAGAVLYYALPRRRQTAVDNLRAAFGADYAPDGYDHLVKALFQNMGRMFMEVAAIPAIDRAYVDRYVRIAPGSQERLDRELAKGKGVLFLTGHFGNWELIPVTGALYGYPTLVLAREQGWPKLNRMLTEYRESKGCRVVTKGFPVRDLIQGLKEGRIVGIVADQDGGKNGVLSPFFGRLASTAPGMIALALSTGAPVLPVFMVRTRGAEHSLIVEEPLEIPQGGTEQRRIQAGVDAYVKVVEKYIRRYPAQWLWLHRRWKTCPQKHILIFDDGKAGHFSQTRALAQRLQAAWKQRMAEDRRLDGRPEPLGTFEKAEVAFRHPALRALLSVVASVVPPRWAAKDFWLRVALTPESYETFRSSHADFSVSCGSAAAAVNLLWARQTRCKAIQILRARFPSWRRFDLAVIPRHDLVGGNVPAKLLAVDGALVPERRVTPEQKKEWTDRLKLSPGKKRIGLLLGGPAKRIELDRADLEQAVSGLLSAAEKMDAELLVTTSRRTPFQVEEWLSRLLGKHPRCRLLVLVNQQRPGPLPDTETAVPCILELADVLAVSGDSVSMVSEAVAAGKPVVAFPPKAVVKGKPAARPVETKHHRFLRQMDEKGRLRLTRPERMEQSVAEAVNGSGSKNPDVLGSDPIVEFLRGWL